MDRPVPMDVDPSIRSRQINYGNRPKRPRNYDPTEQNVPCENETEQLEEYFKVPYEDESEFSFERFCKTVETQENDEESENCAELNFLG